MLVGPQQEGLLIGLLSRIYNKISLKGTLCMAVHKFCNGNGFNKCMGKAIIKDLGRLAKVGVVIDTVFDLDIGASFNTNGSFGFYV